MSSVLSTHPRRDRPVLVTGGCGFIGCNIADTLASRGDAVLVLDSLARAGARENAEWLMARHPDRITIEVGDVRDDRCLRALVTRSSAVLHLAAQVAVTTSLEDPLDDFDVNARGTITVLEAVRKANPGAPVIFASTNKVYGRLLDDGAVSRSQNHYWPAEERLAGGIAEDAPLDFYSPYGCSKGTADQYVHDYARVFGLRTVVLRMSCIYGPRQFGTEDQGWIAHFLLQALRDRPITIYGDGYQVRDALFIEDAVAVWLAALDNIDRVKGRVFNVGGGPDNAISLRELLALIAEMKRRHPTIVFDEWRPGDQPWYVSNIHAVSQALGWRPGIPLRDGLRKLDSWLTTRFAPGQQLSPLRQVHG